MRTVIRVALMLVVVFVGLAVPVTASADVVDGRCSQWEEPGIVFARCAVVEQAANGKVRALGSLEVDVGSGPVVVIAYLQRRDPSGWTFIETSPRIESPGTYVLTATEWHACLGALHRTKINWNYKNGTRTGTFYSYGKSVHC
jgi:hypothetical protein